MNKKRFAIIAIASAIIAISIAFRNSPETFRNIIRSSPEFFPIKGGQKYNLYTIPHSTAVPHGIQDYRRRVAGATFAEYIVVVNAPRNPEALQRVIEEFNASTPVEAPEPPLLDDFYVLRYARTFFRESINVPRDVEFTNDFGIDELADISGGGRRPDIEERIAGIYAGIDETTFVIRPSVYYSPHRYTVPSDPTLNGLYNNIPYHMIPPAAREKLDTEFFRDREIDMLFDD